MAMSDAEFDSEYSRIYALWQAADSVNDGNSRERHSWELKRFAQAR
jgi:hypothetical protein